MWFLFAFAAAVLAAISVIISKELLKGVTASVLTWGQIVISTPIIALFLFREGIPQLGIGFFIAALGSVIFYTLSKIIGYKAIRMSDLSLVYPLISLGPVFTFLVAFFPPLSEKPTLISSVGVFVTLAGTYILNVSFAKEGIFTPVKVLLKNKASFLMLASVIIGSLVIIFDKTAINNTSPKSPIFTLFFENLGICALAPVLYMRNKSFLSQITSNLKSFLILGTLIAFASMFAFWAITEGPVGLSATMFRTQSLFVILFGFLFLKDRPKKETLVGSLIMILGIYLIKAGS
ncbi:hypothetical protein A2165_02295 [Candidatus Curtissbacteria bacterium RBG_13_40_7]|uniref:EamA domain-containing protein n=1 Tax=Candidatus Curtissbacteria bacterium RBG_13_40_7 TaxID=1797706 RepID=A0A1F5FYC4_9BACT|nr:MAG: hypothetical protein A2165_02295 [Candidatus Curtissbacteria bacterium RBG_13_40_7]